MDYPLFLIENPLDLCLEANKPSSSRHLRAWASSSTGRAFGMAIADTILDELTPGDFAVYIFALLSYYRNRHATKVFVPVRDQEDYLSELTRFDMVDIEANGMVLERVAFSVIHACRSLLPKVLLVPYLRPYQLDACIEYSRSTSTLDIYCYVRLSRPCSHQEAVDSVRTLLGVSIKAYEAGEQVAREGDSDNETVFEDIDSIAGISVGSESLSSSTKDCSLKTACY
ncbi:hypothetical protein F5Y08DRAFT_353875 [Xylaria arbuscula]|nr:hypothetical protein F5Y08DRAFT_353875 [Xylaria arbuscula]